MAFLGIPNKQESAVIYGPDASKGWFQNAWNTVKGWFGSSKNDTVNSAPSSLTSDNTLLDELGEWAHNALTGERDYNRQLEVMNKEMAFNSSEAQKVRDYEERMANTSYQRAVDDLIKAGLNPGVAVSQGGASTPTVHSASVGSHSVQKSGDQFSHLLNSMFGVFGSLINGSIRARELSNRNYIAEKMYDLRRDIFHETYGKRKKSVPSWYNDYKKDVDSRTAKEIFYTDTLKDLEEFFNG